MTSVMNASEKLGINPLIASLFQVVASLFGFLLINPFQNNFLFYQVFPRVLEAKFNEALLLLLLYQVVAFVLTLL